MLINMDPNITCVIIGEENIKLTQFVDDTTLILDGSQHSLESALNTLEIFGDYSGLKNEHGENKGYLDRSKTFL